MPEQPANPEPAYDNVDSMLSRKFGKEIANYFSGSPLNRVGFLREDHKFLQKALHHPSTSFLPCNNLQPLVKRGYGTGDYLQFIKYDQLKPIVGENPYDLAEKEQLDQYNSERYQPQMIFLGIDEKVKDGLEYQGKNKYTGAPYFAVDVTPKSSVKDECEKLIKNLEDRGLTFAQGRVMEIDASHGKDPSQRTKYKYSSSFIRRDRIENSEHAWYTDSSQAAIYAEARMLLDWNARNPFCAACGNPTISLNGGFKRGCPPKDLAREVGKQDREPCVTRGRISNLSFPRTDPTVIMAIVNSANTHILLGRQKVWPPYWYSTLAGFAEPAESIEEAVRREVYEEAGILVGRVVIHSTQPWPYPANLMIGAIGQAIPEGETIDLGHDPELDNARWVDFEELKHGLKVGTSGLSEDAGPDYKEGDLRLPPSTAIAHQLMQAAASGFVAEGAKL